MTRDDYLLTEGVTSIVRATDKGRERGLGHIALFDWDDHVTPEDAREYHRNGWLVGPTVVFNSSGDSWHGWNLHVQRFSHVARTLERGNDDTKHRKVGLDRGWWRLRVGEKRRDGGEAYKPAPAFVEVIDMADSERAGNLRISDPHLTLAEVCGLPSEVADRLRERYHPVGDSIEVVAYVTMTDIEKHVRRRVFE